MAQADVLQLVTDVADSLNDATACTTYYGDVVFLMGLDPDGTLVTASTIDPGVNTLPTTMPTTSITTLAVLYDRTHLSKTGIQGAGVWDSRWAITKGTPKVWLDQNQPRHTIAIVPIPVTPPSGAALPVDPSTTNPGFAGLTVLYTESRTNVHGDEELALALEILCREFSRDSDHTDRTLAQSCRTLSGVLFRMLELSLTDDVPATTKGLEEAAS
jgi:hypothetical protein